MTIPLSLYIHFPWCIKRCPYCDFNAHTLKGDLPEAAYIDALIEDLKQQLILFPQNRPIHSVFMGGGTPSLIQPTAIKRLLQEISQLIELPKNTEVTLEANPGSLMSESQLAAYREAGVNRLSIGVQSFNAQHLKTLGRIHCPKQALSTIEQAHQAGFERLNIDIMYGLPQQSTEEAIDDLERACSLPVDHFSWYQLTLEPNTLFHHQQPTLPDEDSIEEMETKGRHILQKNAFNRYEVSAYSKQSPSQHNLNYWRFGDYLGIGAGAHGKLTHDHTITRTLLVKHPTAYLSTPTEKRISTKIVLSKNQIFECLLNSFRLTDGFSISLLKERCFTDLSGAQRVLDEATKKEWIVQGNGIITPTALGQRYLNDLIALFLEPC